MSRYDVLFESVSIGPVTAPNRFYAVPHATGHGWTQPDGSSGIRAMKAEGGWGVVAVQMTEIAPDSDLANHPMDRLWNDRHGADHARQVDAIKSKGALAAIELAHGGLRSRNLTTGLPVPGPANLPILRPELPIQAYAMSVSDIAAFRLSHRSAVQRAIDAGYDIIYVYAAHDLSLLSHFLSVRTNKRTDLYGGSLTNRIRLLREVLEDTVELAHAHDRAVALRFSVAEPDQPVGLTHDGEGRDVVEALAEIPDLWDVNIAGWPADSAPSRFSEEGFQFEYTEFVKQLTSKPVVGVGRFTTPDRMVSAIKKGRLDFIGAARPSIADPFLPAKIRENRTEDIRECIGCNICVSMDGYGVPIRCTQNPTVGEEHRRNWHPETLPVASRQKRCLIVGAGPAGLECALTLAKAGHEILLAEAESDAGGRVRRESRLAGLNAWSRVADYRLQQLRQMPDVQIYPGNRLTVEDILDFDGDHVVLATGSSWCSNGMGSTRSVSVNFTERQLLTPDTILLTGAVEFTDRHCVVYDDDHYYMASVLAEMLAQAGNQVSYATPLPQVATWTDMTLEQQRIINRFNTLGVNIHVNTTLTDSASFRCTLTGKAVEIEHDTLMMVGARHPETALWDALTTNRTDHGIHRVGDCVAPGTIQAAVLSGHTLARHSEFYT